MTLLIGRITCRLCGHYYAVQCAHARVVCRLNPLVPELFLYLQSNRCPFWGTLGTNGLIKGRINYEDRSNFSWSESRYD